MTYNELRTALKPFKAQGLTTVALNAKKDILQAEYDRLTSVKDDTDTLKDKVASISEIPNPENILCDRLTTQVDDNEPVTLVEIPSNIPQLENFTAEKIETPTIELIATEEAVNSDAIIYPSPSDYDPEKSINYFAFLDDDELPSPSQSQEIFVTKSPEPITSKAIAIEDLDTDNSPYNLMTVNLIIFLTAVITIYKKVFSVTSRLMDVLSRLSIEYHHRFSTWLRGFKMPQFA